jgi:DNA gyrase subunit A
MTRPEDEVFAITSAGGVIRTRAGEVKLSGRQTMGVRLMNLGPGDSVVALARNAESLEPGADEATGDAPLPGEAGGEDETSGDAASVDNETAGGDVL